MHNRMLALKCKYAEEISLYIWFYFLCSLSPCRSKFDVVSDDDEIRDTPLEIRSTVDCLGLPRTVATCHINIEYMVTSIQMNNGSK